MKITLSQNHAKPKLQGQVGISWGKLGRVGTSWEPKKLQNFDIKKTSPERKKKERRTI